MKTNYKKIAVGLLILSTSLNIFAVDVIPKKSKYYYDLGGGSNINLPPPSRSSTINLGGYANGDLGYTCTGFNPSISIGNSLNNIQDSAISLGWDIVSSATSAIGSYPMYILSKASPELYNVLQNAMAGANETFKVSMKDCETALSDIKKGKSPYEDWFSISDSQGWLDGFNDVKKGEKVDINNTTKNITKNHREKGIPWVEGEKIPYGGKGQTPINVIQDIIKAGYNAIASESSSKKRALNSNEPLLDKKADLYKFWKYPNDAAVFGRYVLGEITITSDDNKTNDTSAGMGLVGALKACPFASEHINDDGSIGNITCVKKVRDSLIKLVQSNARPSVKDLKNISAGSMIISSDIIQNIRNMSDDNKAITISKLAEDIAMQNLVEEGLMLRRLLIAGSQTRPVQNLEPALRAVYKTISQLDTELNNLSFEHDMRSKFSSRTINAIMSESYNSAQNAFNNQVTQKSLDMDSGAVYGRGGN